MLEPLAATKSSSFLRSSAAIQRAIWNSAGSNSTGSPYSSFSRTFSTSSCSGLTTPTSAAPLTTLSPRDRGKKINALFERLHQKQRGRAATRLSLPLAGREAASLSEQQGGVFARHPTRLATKSLATSPQGGGKEKLPPPGVVAATTVTPATTVT